MGRGRQKAKQTKMARKLKYMTTDTDYNELEKELSSREPDAAGTADDSIGAADPDHNAQGTGADGANTSPSMADSSTAPDSTPPENTSDDLDEYAAWAAEAAKKAESQPPKKPAVHKPFPKMPLPGKLKPGSEK
ncbi:MAG: DUF3073 domain-containing protein [Scardovia wiggsiae]|uniref:DUF3073 domain-containing protein n=1 Tax=Scardovia wiggsiae TaxID=230143 RepID=UPI001CB4452A|nr:DUF3073 domain-containing protein [Scardovia wiggsiae]